MVSYVAQLPANMDSTYGLAKTTWSDVKKTLRWLGGRPDRTTNSHGSELYEMPSGTKISTGKHKDLHGEIMYDAIKQLMDEVRRARIEPLLFLAVLDRAGCSWHRKPTVVDKLARWLRKTQQPLRTQAQQQAALKKFSRAMQVEAESDSGKEPSMDTQPAHGHAEQGPHPESTQPEQGPSQAVQTKHQYKTGDIFDLADLKDGKVRKAAGVRLAKMIRKQARPVRQLIEDGHIVTLRLSPKRQIYYYDEQAAMQLAHDLQELYGSKSEPEAPQPEPEPVQVEPQASEPEPSGGPVEASNLAPDFVQGNVVASEPVPESTPDPSVDVVDPPNNVGEAIFVLCQRYGIRPKWLHTTRLDVEQTVFDLGIACVEELNRR